MFTVRGIEWRMFHQNRQFSVRGIQEPESPPPPTPPPASKRSPESPPRCSCYALVVIRLTTRATANSQVTRCGRRYGACAVTMPMRCLCGPDRRSISLTDVANDRTRPIAQTICALSIYRPALTDGKEAARLVPTAAPRLWPPHSYSVYLHYC